MRDSALLSVFIAGSLTVGPGKAEARGSVGRFCRKAIVRPTGRKRAGAEGPTSVVCSAPCPLWAPEPRIPAHTFLMRSLWLREGRGSMRKLPSVSITLAIKEKPHCAIKGLEGDRQILARWQHSPGNL